MVLYRDYRQCGEYSPHRTQKFKAISEIEVISYAICGDFRARVKERGVLVAQGEQLKFLILSVIA